MYAECGWDCTSPERTNPEHTSPERTSRLERDETPAASTTATTAKRGIHVTFDMSSTLPFNVADTPSSPASSNETFLASSSDWHHH